MESFSKDAVVGESETIREVEFLSSGPPHIFFEPQVGVSREV